MGFPSFDYKCHSNRLIIKDMAGNSHKRCVLRENCRPLSAAGEAGIGPRRPHCLPFFACSIVSKKINYGKKEEDRTEVRSSSFSCYGIVAACVGQRFRLLEQLQHALRRCKVRLTPFPPGGETCARSLAPPLPTEPASLGFGGDPCAPGRGSQVGIRRPIQLRSTSDYWSSCSTP